MSKIRGLNHLHTTSADGVNVYILDKGEIIDSEAEAMLQALHSRSTWWLLHHLHILEEKGADNFMAKFYVWYGHKSIGDCWSATIFIEWLSMLAAKAIQDTKLYNGQESSTRYIDFSKQTIINPWNTDLWKTILEKQRAFYLYLQEPLIRYMEQLYPNDQSTHEQTYIKTVKAKVFDITRWFLPAWCSTNLARHTTLRQIADRILVLRHHPLQEVRNISYALQECIIKKYPNSFSTHTFEQTEMYLESVRNHYYQKTIKTQVFEVTHDAINKVWLTDYLSIFNNRPNNKTELPAFLDLLGTISFSYHLDFWSFRDVQRHRSPFQRMPLLTTHIGFHEWYLDSLPKQLQEEAKDHLKWVVDSIQRLDIAEDVQQYFLPMWFKMQCELMWTLPALTYLSELRSSQYVHPTLRPIAKKIWSYLQDTYWIKVFLDNTEDGFDTRRGTQDIVNRK